MSLSIKKKAIKKAISVVTMVATVVCMSGVASFSLTSLALADGVVDGTLIKSNATNSDATPTLASLDVYIVKLVGTKKFKRMILNPTVFDSYGLLNWEDIQTVSQSVMDEYTNSGLVRVDMTVDPSGKVYAMAPDGDSGSKSWVDLTETEFKSVAGSEDGDSIYTINATDAGSYSAVGDLTTTTELETFYSDGTLPDAPVGGGDLAVALSASTPASATVPTGATGVVFTNFNVTASNDGDIILGTLAIKRSGLGDEAKIDKVYIYDGITRLTSGRSISDSTQTATFSNVNYTVAAGTTKTLSLVVDVTATSATGEHALGIESASAITAGGAIVSGSFPVNGNTMTFSSTTIGQVDVEENDTGTVSGSTYDYTVYSGDTNVEIARFNVLLNSVEDGLVESITLYNAGREVIENVELYRGSTLVATGSVNDDYITFNLDTPYEIDKSNNVQFMVMADIVDARDTDTVKLYARYKTDVRVKGATYGYYLTVADHDSDSNSMVSPLDTTVQVAMTEINAGKVTMTSDGTPLTNNVAKNSNDVVLLNFNITTQSGIDVEQVGIIYTLGDTTDALTSNLELVCDGSIVAEWANPLETTPLHTDTSVWSIDANDTISCQVRTDISSSGTSTIVASVDVSQWTFKDSSTGDSIATADIIPSADIIGSTMTVVSASVTGSLAGVPASQTWVAGDSLDVNGFNFAAGDAEGVTVTSITLQGYHLVSSTINPTANTDVATMKDVVASVELYADGVKIGDTKTLTTTGVAIFNTLNWEILAGATETLVVKVTTAKGSVPANSTIKFAVTAASAEYTSDGTGLTSTITAIDEGSEVTVFQIITASGTIAAVIDPSTPASDLIVMNSTDIVMSKVKFTATNEDFVVEKLQITKAGSDDATFLNAKVRYTDSNSVVQTAVGVFSGNVANLSNLDIFVPKDGSAVVEFLADLNTKSGGSTNNVTTSLSLTASEFRAVAQGSGEVDTSGDVSTGLDMYVYESVPTFAFASDTPSGSLIPSANTLIAKIGITASAEKDITFDSTATNQLIIEVASSDATPVAGDVTIKNDEGVALCAATAVTFGTATSVTCDFALQALTVAAGTTEYIYVYAVTTSLSAAGDSIQVWLNDADVNVGFGINSSGDYSRGAIIFKGDIYGGSLVKP